MTDRPAPKGRGTGLSPAGRFALPRVEPDPDAVDRTFEVPAVRVVRVAGQPASGLNWFAGPRQDGDAVPCLLPVPDRVVPRLLDRVGGELLLRRLEFLQARHVGP